MGKAIEAQYERGVFRPLQSVELEEGRRVLLSVEPMAPACPDADEQIAAWRTVFAGLSDDEQDDVERIATDRASFFRTAGQSGR